MVQLINQKTGEPVGVINEEQLQFMIDHMEEEGITDRDYAVTPMLLDYLQTQGVDPELMSTLRNALGGKDEVILEWRSVLP